MRCTAVCFRRAHRVRQPLRATDNSSDATLLWGGTAGVILSRSVRVQACDVRGADTYRLVAHTNLTDGAFIAAVPYAAALSSASLLQTKGRFAPEAALVESLPLLADVADAWAAVVSGASHSGGGETSGGGAGIVQLALYLAAEAAVSGVTERGIGAASSRFQWLTAPRSVGTNATEAPRDSVPGSQVIEAVYRRASDVGVAADGRQRVMKQRARDLATWGAVYDRLAAHTGCETPAARGATSAVGDEIAESTIAIMPPRATFLAILQRLQWAAVAMPDPRTARTAGGREASSDETRDDAQAQRGPAVRTSADTAAEELHTTLAPVLDVINSRPAPRGTTGGVRLDMCHAADLLDLPWGQTTGGRAVHRESLRGRGVSPYLLFTVAEGGARAGATLCLESSRIDVDEAAAPLPNEEREAFTVALARSGIM
jgi:hypothetical protein